MCRQRLLGVFVCLSGPKGLFETNLISQREQGALPLSGLDSLKLISPIVLPRTETLFLFI